MVNAQCTLIENLKRKRPTISLLRTGRNRRFHARMICTGNPEEGLLGESLFDRTQTEIDDHRKLLCWVSRKKNPILVGIARRDLNRYPLSIFTATKKPAVLKHSAVIANRSVRAAFVIEAPVKLRGHRGPSGGEGPHRRSSTCFTI